jgi:GTPase SAR1 family protein
VLSGHRFDPYKRREEMRPPLLDIKSEFISRETELSLFIKMVERDQYDRILAFYGFGGIGKTWLLARLAHECDSRGWPVTTIDFDDGFGDYLAILTAIGNQIGRGRFVAFNNTLDRYIQLVRDMYVPMHQAGKSGEVVEVPREFTGSLDSVLGVNLVGIRLTKGINSLLKSMERDTLEAFKANLKEIAEDAPVVLLFDTYEHIEETQLGKRVQQFVMSIGIDSSVYVVLSGRNKLRWSREWLKRLSQSELSYFNYKEVKRYLLEKRCLNHIPEDVVNAVWQLTKGHPLCVGLSGDLLTERWEEGGEVLTDPEVLEQELGERMVSSFLMERILERMGVKLQTVVMCAAVPRWYDAGILKVVGKISDPQEVVDRLRKYSFVRLYSKRGYTFHEIVRELLIAKWYRDNADEFISINRRALKFFEGKMRSGSPRDHGRYNLERLYHQLIVDENKGMKLFGQLFRDAESSQRLNYCQSLLDIAKSYPELLNAVKENQSE